MKSACLIAILSLAASAAAGASSRDGCTFDQDHQDQALAKLAAQHPGGQVSKLDRSVTWNLPDGAAFVAGQGGCTDFATTVRLQFGRHQDPSIDKVLPQLVAMTRRYLSAAYADDIADAWARKTFRRSVLRNKVVEFEAQRDARSLKPFPLVIESSATGISADWQEH